MLRLSGAWVVFPVPLFIVIGFDSVEYFPFVPGCVDSEWVCSVPLCVTSTSSVSLVFVLRSCLVVSDAPWDFTSIFSGLSVPVRGLPSGRVSAFASLCKICSATVFLLSLVPGIFVCPATFTIGLFALVRPSGIFSTGFVASAGLRDVFSTGFVAPVYLLSAFSVLSLRGVAPTTGCGVSPVFALVRAPIEDNRRSADVVPLSLGVCRCFVDKVSAG